MARRAPGRTGELAWLGALLLLAAAVRLAFLWISSETPLAGDEREYFARAVRVAEGLPLSSMGARPPGMELFFGGLLGLFGTNSEVARIGNALLGAGVVLPVYAIARSLGGAPAARIAAGIAAFYPSFIAFSTGLWSEPLYMLLVSSALACALTSWAGWQRALSAGLLFGLGALTRETGLLLPLVTAVWWTAVESGTWMARIRAPAMMLLLAAGLVLPWTTYINGPDRPFALLSRTTYQNLYIGNAGPAERIGADGRVELLEPRLHYYTLGENRLQSETAARTLAFDAIRARLPGWPFEKLVEQVPRFLAPTSFTQQRLLTPKSGDRPEWAYRFRFPAWEERSLRVAAAVVIAAIYGAVVLAGTAGLLLALPARGSSLLLAFVGAQLVPCIVAFASSRFRLPSMLAMAVGCGLCWVLRERLREKGGRRNAAVAALAVLGLVLAWTAPRALSPIWG